MQFDLLIQGGEVIDPGGNQSGKMDVAISGNRIAAVDANIPIEAAVDVVDANGQIVTPGLIDLHTHVYYNVTYWGIQADPVAARSGVTTWLDVGSAGGYNLPGFREWIASPAMSRIYSLINISSIGLTAPTWELSNLDYCDVDLCTQMIEQNEELVLGIKARIDRDTTRGTGIAPLRLAREAADRVSRPVMVHIGGGPPSLDEVLALMNPGDILTHCFTGHNMRIIDESGQLLDAAKRAWDGGIVLDIGHGAGSFSFETAEIMIDQGLPPDVISSDIHQLSIHGPLYDLPTCMSKFLALGMNLTDVVRAATVRPAEVMGLDESIGTLRAGALADIALFRVEEGDFSFYDVHMNKRLGSVLLRNTLTIVDGKKMAHMPDGPMAPWIEISEEQQQLVDRGHTPSAMACSC